MISLSPGCRHLSLKLSHHSIKKKAINGHYIKPFIFSISDVISLGPGCRHVSFKLSHHSIKRKAVNGQCIKSFIFSISNVMCLEFRIQTSFFKAIQSFH